FEVTNLKDLKRVLKEIHLNQEVWMWFRNANVAYSPLHHSAELKTSNEETPVFIRIHEVITDQDFTLEQLRAEVSNRLDSIIPGQRNWRSLTKQDCRVPLAEMSRHLKQPL